MSDGPKTPRRELYDEIMTLRQELYDTKADLKRTVDRAEGLAANLHRNTEQIGRLQRENAQLESTLKSTCDQRDTWRTMHHEVEKERDAARRERDRARRALTEHADCDECEPEIKAALGLGPDPAEAEIDRLRTAIKHVADLATQGNTVGLIAAAARLGEVLDGGT